MAERDIMAEFKSSSQAAHDHVETVSPLALLMRGQGDINTYIQVLKANLSYYRPLERQLMDSKDPRIAGIQAFMEPRLKTAMIEADLAKLGVSQAEIAAVADYKIPAMDTAEKTLGALYTLEGSTNGGIMIASVLKRTFGWEIMNSENFLNPYGKQTHMKWEQFGDFARAQDAKLHLNLEEACAAVNDTFAAIEACTTGDAQAASHVDKEAKRVRPTKHKHH